MPEEAAPRQTKYGLVHDEPGWFVVNASEARWAAWDRLGLYCNFEGKRRFPQLGFNVNVLMIDDPTVPPGTVSHTDPAEGTPATTGSTITIYVANQPAVHSPPTSAGPSASASNH